MADKMLTARLLESGNIITPKGRILYPSLFKPTLPKGEKDPEKAKYQISLLIPKGADISVIESAIAETINDNVSEKVRKTTKVKKPILKTEDQPRFVEYADEFPLMIRCNAKFKPDVIGPSMKPVGEDQEADEVYSGRWGRLSVRAFFFDHPTGGKGVSLGLQNVQLLDNDDLIAGDRVRADAEFEAVGDELADLEA